MQNNVNIMTREDELVIKRGDLNLRKDIRELALASVKYLYSDINDLRKRYISLGFHLSEMRTMKYYEDFGYATLEEFCAVNIGLDKSAVSRCINVFKRFSAVNNDMNCTHLMYVDDRWKDYSYSQLCEMVSMSDDLLKTVRPDMSVRELRDLKKKKNVSVATSQLEGKKILNVSDLNNCKGIVKINKVKFADRLGEAVFDVYSSSGVYMFNFRGDLLYSGKSDGLKNIVVRLDEDVVSDLVNEIQNKIVKPE